MDNLVLKQRRVIFSSSGRDKQEESEGIRKIRQSPSPQQARPLKEDNKEQIRQERKRFSSQMSWDYDAREDNFAAAVAATAFSINSLDQAELQYQKSKAKSRKDEITAELQSSSRATRLFSNKEAKNGVEVLRKRSIGHENKVSQRASPAKQPSHTASARQAAAESQADAWEKAQMKKVQNRYEKTKYAIFAWENKKKIQAELKMEKRKGLLEQKRGQHMQHYQHKLSIIEKIAGGARAQLEEKRRSEEFTVKDKAKKRRSGGHVPVKCFCFTC